MPFLIVVAVVTFLSCAAAGLDDHAVRAMTAVGHGAVALAAIVLPRPRSAAFGTLQRYSSATWPYAGLLVLAATMSGGFGIGASTAPYDAERAMVSLAGFGFFFIAMSAIATAVGRNRVIAALQWTPVALALLTIFDRLDGKGDFFGLSRAPMEAGVAASFPSPAVSAAVFGLFAILAVFAIVDHLTRRPPSTGGPEPALMRRLFLPVAALIASANLILLSGEWAASAATLAGLALFLLVAWRRQRRSRNSRKEPAYIAAFVVILSCLAVLLHAAKNGMQMSAFSGWTRAPLTGTGLGSGGAPEAGDGARWLTEGGLLGAGALVAALALLLWMLWRADDHGRKPSRGFALGASLVLCAVLQGAFGAGFASPAASGVLAGLLGVAAAYVDPEPEALKVKANARTRTL